MGGTAISKTLTKLSNAATIGVGEIDEILKKSGMTFRDLEILYGNNSKGYKEFATSIGMTSNELANLIKAKSDLEGFAEVAGMTADEFSKKFGKDAIGAFQLFIQGLSNTDEAGENTLTMLNDLGITEVRLRDSLIRAANSAGLMTDAVDRSNKAWGENTALSIEAERRYETLASQLEMTKNQLRIVAVAIYEKFAEPVKEGVKSLRTSFATLKRELAGKEINEAIETIAEATGEMIKALGQFIAKTVPKLLKGLANLIKNWNTVSKVLGTVITGILTYTAVSNGFVAVTKLKASVTTLYRVALGLLQGKTKQAIAAQLGLNAAQLANPMAILVGLAAALAAGLVYLAAKTLKAKEVETEYTKQLDGEIEKIENLTAAREEELATMEERNEAQAEAISAGLSEIDHLEDLWGELQKITDENGKIKEGYKSRADFIIGELNDALGTEIERNGDIIQGYKDIRAEIDKTIEKKKAMIILDAKEEDYKEAIQGEATARKEAAKASATVEETSREYGEAGKAELEARAAYEREVKRLEEKFGHDQELWNLGEQAVASASLKPLEKELQKREKEAQKVGEKLTSAIKDEKTATKLLDEIISDIVDYEATAEDVLNEDFGKVINKHSGLVRDWVNADAETIKIGTQQWIGHIEGYEKELEEALAAGDKTAVKIAEQGIKEGQTELKELASLLKGQVSTIEEMSPEVQAAWRNLATNSTGIYLNAIAGLSPEQQRVMEELTGITATGGVNITAEWAKVASNSLYALTGDQILFQDAGNGMVQMVVNGIAIGKPLAEDEMEALVASVNQKIKDGKAGASQAGAMLAEGVGEGFENKKANTNVFNKIKSFATKALGWLNSALGNHSPSVKGKEAGINLLKGVELGLGVEEGKALKQVNDFGKNAVQTLQDKLNGARTNLNASIGLSSKSLNELGQIENAGSKVVNIYQTNNSPEALDEVEIYRRTKNAAQLAART